jgi:tetratricopeptide (TPR) repeat protein
MKFPIESTSVRAVRQIVIACAVFFFLPHSTPAQSDTYAKRLERAAALIVENRLNEAEQQLQSLLRVAPNTAAALDLLGTVRAKQGRLDDAETLFTRAVRADNQLIGAHMNLAYLYLLKGVPEKTALELQEVLRLDPHNADASYKLAWLLFTQARLDECIGFIEKVKQSRPLSVPLLIVLGDAYLKKGDVDQAEKSYLAAINEQSRNADALLGLARVSQSRGNTNAALEYLSRAKELLADSPDRLYKFAVAASALKLSDDAIWALKRAIELRSDEPSYFMVLGIIQLGLKKPDLQDAEENFRESLKRQPDNVQAQLHLGYVLLKQKKYSEAGVWLEKSIQKQTGSPEAFYYLGLIAQEQNENERAIELFQKVIQLEPGFANAHIALGVIYLKLKNYPRAQQELETGVKINPDSSKGHYNLAILYARLENPQRAQEEMRILARLESQSKGQQDESEAIAPPPPR